MEAGKARDRANQRRKRDRRERGCRISAAADQASVDRGWQSPCGPWAAELRHKSTNMKSGGEQCPQGLRTTMPTV